MDECDLKLMKDIALIDTQLQISSSGVLESLNDLTPNNLAIASENDDTLQDSTARGDPFSPAAVNQSCQTLLKTLEKQILSLLEENRKEREALQRYLDNSGKPEAPAKGSEVLLQLKHVGMPYFKDGLGYPQPRNDVVRERIARGCITCSEYLVQSSMWTKQAKDCLKAAILKEIKSSQTGENENRMSAHARPVDWMKISTIDMNARYSPSECESKWNLHLSPDLNKSNWTNDEMNLLESLAEKFEHQDWDNIAEELGTKRSGLQCCIQYFAKNGLSEGKWLPKEDAALKALVERYKSGDVIPWTKVVWFFQSRSRKQCQERYTGHLRSDLKKGYFSKEEDRIIILGIKLFDDFGKIAKFLPGRVTAQIRSRFYHLIGTKMSEFSEEEDKLLISLTKKYSKEWLKISDHFKDRSKLQCRKRYQALQRRGNGEPSLRAKPSRGTTKQGKNKKATQKSTRGLKKGSDAYKEILDYFSACSENFLGPKVQNFPSENDLKILCTKMKATMAMLSVGCDLSRKAGVIRSLKDNCDFDPLDIALLDELSRGSAIADGFSLNGMSIPPNYPTLIGLTTLAESRSRVQLRHREAEGLPPAAVEARTGGRLFASEAKELFRSRLRSLFLLPQLLLRVPTADLISETFRRGKTKKPKRKSKRRLKAHAKFMSDVHREKRRKQEGMNADRNRIEATASREKDEQARRKRAAEPEAEQIRKIPRRSLGNKNI